MEEGLAKGASKNGKAAIAEIIGVMFMSRTYAHMAHLKTGSFAKHKALNEFYDEVVDLADSLAEVSQGLFGRLDIPFVDMMDSVTEPIKGIESQAAKIKQLGSTCSEPYLGSILQEIEALYRTALYKMKELS